MMDATTARVHDPVASRTFERIAILVAGAALLWILGDLCTGPTRLSLAHDVLGDFLPFVAWPAAAMTAIVVISSGWRVLLWLCYRPIPPLAADDPRLPLVTVVVPAYNEGEIVASCIRSILASDYPADRLRVVAVDDGSRDDTWSWMTRASCIDPARVSLVRLPENRGKRHALFAGFSSAGTPVVVTVDSDTILPADAIRSLVTPLVVRDRVGAVAGRIEVLNRDDSLVTRMLGVRYRIGFDFIRAYQSRLDSVFVCPGACTAYRMEAIRDGLQGWLGHRFLGAPCHNGDDHHLTNLVLRNGWASVYQGNAVASTRVPSTYRGLSLMYLRWARSNVRESLVYLGFAPRLARRLRNLPAILDAATLIAQIPLRLYLLVFGYAMLLLYPGLLVRSIAAALAYSILHVAVYLRSERSLDAAYAVLYGVFSLLTLQWIYPWAVVTVRHTKWLTR
jgi:hyaluronan synthase